MARKHTKKSQRISLASSKKASAIIDSIFYAVVILALGLTSVLIVTMISEFNDSFNEMDLSPTAAKHMNDLNANYSSLADSMLVFFLIMGAVFAVMASFAIKTNPTFFVISIVFIAIVLAMAAVFSNIYSEVSSDPALSAAANELQATTWVNNNLVIIVGGLIFAISIILYSKLRSPT